ncbi:MAG: DUF4280 domain-containing protein [Nitriliruptoraceae bacterium]
MPPIVTMGALLTCSFGVAPASLVVTPENRVSAGPLPAATIMDNIPLKNIMPFGMCTSLSNPTVASATAAALGVLTPMPCVPVIPAPWAPGSPTVSYGGKPTLTSACQAQCAYGGVITISSPGQTSVQAA